MKSARLAEPWRVYDEVEARLSAPLSERMLDLAGLRPGMRVLDLAAGRGEPAVRGAKRVAPNGSVLGIDVAESVLAIGRERAAREGVTNLELCVGDAEALAGVTDESFDAATARWGLMYMGAPVTALASARRALRPGGVLMAAFWAEPARVAWAAMPRKILARFRQVPSLEPPDPNAPGAFRYAARDTIERDLQAAGFAVEHVEEMDVPVIEAPDGAGIVAWVRDLGLVKEALELSDADYAAWERGIAEEAEKGRVGDVVQVGGVSRVVVARR
ncbi:MAG TPA: methyltransferase domain-containing protein [Polyangiaceae bacterium]